MEGEVTQMATNEILQRITDLEDTYAEALKDKMDVHGLNRIWRRIKELQTELSQRAENGHSKG